MALSMDEQRMLAEIERRLAAEDPKLAARLSAFRRPSRVGIFRSARARVVGSLLTVAVVAMVSLMVYAILPFRSGSRTAGHPVTTVASTGTGQRKLGAGPGTKTAQSSSGAAARSPASTAPAKSPAARSAAAGSTAHKSPASHPAGNAVHQADGAPGTTAQPVSNASHGP
jgi:hypothetical protein